MAVYSIKKRLLRQKAMLMKQMTLQEIFKKANCCSAASLLENPAPGPSLDVHLQPDEYDNGNTDLPFSPRSSSSPLSVNIHTFHWECYIM
jgi:hypothetical protein